jgi:transketolase
MTPEAFQIRENILKISHDSGHGHIPTCFSIIELLLGVYDTMNHLPENPDSEERDLFILSKGHASLGLYCVLANNGYFPIEEVYEFGKFGSKYGCHVDRKKVLGVEASTGSLGHGIGLAVGMAMAFKLSGNNKRVYVLIGDGESNEGTVWEAIMVAVHQDLDNLVILVDNNCSQTRCLPLDEPKNKFTAFGCDVEVVNGHDLIEIKNALDKKQESVRVIVGNTKKGYGCNTLVEDMFAWHRRSPNDSELTQLLEELNDSK